MPTTLTLKNQYGTYTVEIMDDDMGLDRVVEELVIPVLLGSGFTHETIRDYFGDNE